MSAEAVQEDTVRLVTLEDIEEARQRLQRTGLVVRTPVLRDVQAVFPEVGNTRLHLKMENMQNTGSFKVRGAVHKLEHMVRESKSANKTLITISSGNFGKAFAFYLQKAGVPGICAMPSNAPDNRTTLLKSMGVRVERYPLTDIHATVDHLVKDEGYVLCSSLDDPHIISANGGIALEILEDGLEPDVVVVCCGSGSNVSGIAAAFHLASKKPVRVYAVEPEGANAMQESLRVGHAVSMDCKSVAAGLAVPCISELYFAHCREYVEDVLLVSDQEILQCMRTLLERGIKAEPAGCAAMAAMLNGRVPDVEGKEVVVVITGGNVTVEELNVLLSSP